MDFLSNLGSDSQLGRLRGVADQVNLIEEDFQGMFDVELREQADTFKEHLEDGEDLDRLMPEAFAAVRKAAVRALNKRHLDAQIMGGVALCWDDIVEMKTGEGRTLVGILPSYPNALSGDDVHTVTTNDYLAKYQSEQMGRIHHSLSLEVGVIPTLMSPAGRHITYQADITYGTNNEFGLGYLRDSMALSSEDLVQRGHHFVIVGEVDSILINEAHTLLVISGSAQDTHEWYPVSTRVARSMKYDQHYEVDEKKRTIAISGVSIEMIEDRLGIDNLYRSANTPLISHLSNVIKAKELFRRNKNYVMLGNETLIVDGHTEHTLAGRRHNEDLYQALGAKEGVKIKDEYQTLATVTLQNYFRIYDKLAGTVGTTETEEPGFRKIYGLEVIPAPTNISMIRINQHDRVYRMEEAKYKAVTEDAVLRHEDEQPVLIGTVSVAKSELLSGMLRKGGIPHEVLNAKQRKREAAVVVQTGRKGAATVSTNTTGRGTDIMLGGNPEFLADPRLRRRGLDPVETPEEYETQQFNMLKILEGQVKAEHDKVVEASGLYVIGSERHESRRTDNQLRGRSGRQGDPGESRFYLLLFDDLMRLFHPEVLERALIMFKVPDGVPVDSRLISNATESTQKQVGSQNFEMRGNVLRHDDVTNRRRYATYRGRRRVLDRADLPKQLRDRATEVVAAIVRQHTVDIPEGWDLGTFPNELKTPCPVDFDQEEIEEEIPIQEKLAEMPSDNAYRAYDEREETLGSEIMRELGRQMLLSMVDRNWWEHLYGMDYLCEGIGLRATAQRDPLVEYQREGGDMFIAIQEAPFEQITGMLFSLQVNQPEPMSVGVVVDAEGKPEDVLARAAVVSESEAKLRCAESLAKGLGGKREKGPTYSALDESGKATTSCDDGAKKSAGKTTTGSSGDGNCIARRKKARRRRRIPEARRRCYGRRIG